MSAIEETVNQGTVNAALEISARRANTLRQIKALIVNGKESEAMQLLKKHLGIESHLKLVKAKRR